MVEQLTVWNAEASSSRHRAKKLNPVKTYLSSIFEALTPGQAISMAQICKKVSRLAHSTRARVYELVSAGKVERISRGLYVLATESGAHAGIQGDSREVVKALADGGSKFDCVILDLPYTSEGVKGGNRDIARFPVISPAEFGEILDQIKRVANDDAPIYFIFSNGKSSARARKAYEAEMMSRFTKVSEGDYTKLSANGKPCQFMGRMMPTEAIVAYSISGKCQTPDLNIADVRPSGSSAYPTQKPMGLMKRMLSSLSPKNWVLDPFAGSGATYKASQELGLNTVNIDIQHNPLTF